MMHGQQNFKYKSFYLQNLSNTRKFRDLLSIWGITWDIRSCGQLRDLY